MKTRPQKSGVPARRLRKMVPDKPRGTGVPTKCTSGLALACWLSCQDLLTSQLSPLLQDFGSRVTGADSAELEKTSLV